jgi:zinc transporter ZupT
LSSAEYILLFVSVLLGGGLGLWIQRDGSFRALPLILSFSGAYLLSLAALHLLPGVFHDHGREAGWWLLAGFMIQLLLESLSQGVEHGHIHAQQHARPWLAWQIMIGLSLHAFLEGLPLGSYAAFSELHAHDHSGTGTAVVGNPLLYGIVLHKAPAAFALTALLRRSGFRSTTVWVCLGIFAACSPLAAALSSWAQLDARWIQRLMALVIGSFLPIATTILFEADNRHHHGIDWRKLIAIVLGGGLAALSV